MVEAQTKARPLIWNSSKRIYRSTFFCEGFSFPGHSTVSRMWTGSVIWWPESMLSGTVLGRTTAKFVLDDFLLGEEKNKSEKEKHEIMDELPPQHWFCPLQSWVGWPCQSLVLGHRTQQGLSYTHGQRHKHSSNTTMLWTLKSNAGLTMELRPGSGWECRTVSRACCEPLLPGTTHTLCDRLSVDFCAVCLPMRETLSSQRVTKNIKRKFFSRLFSCTKKYIVCK